MSRKLCCHKRSGSDRGLAAVQNHISAHLHLTNADSPTCVQVVGPKGPPGPMVNAHPRVDPKITAKQITPVTVKVL